MRAGCRPWRSGTDAERYVVAPVDTLAANDRAIVAPLDGKALVVPGYLAVTALQETRKRTSSRVAKLIEGTLLGGHARHRGSD
jgi:hypothetical protein